MAKPAKKSADLECRNKMRIERFVSAHDPNGGIMSYIFRRGGLKLSFPCVAGRKVALNRAALVVVVLVIAPYSSVNAQSTVSPSADWNGSYGFSSASERNVRLLQADIIKKGEVGYYEGLANQTYHVTNNVTNKTINEIGQQTTTIGAVNNSTNNIDIRNSSNIDISNHNSSTSTGCQNGSITIDSTPVEGASTVCN